MIKNLIAYQEKDKARIELLQSIEGGRVKREINASNRTISDARATLLELEREAKELTSSYESTAKMLNEYFDRIEKLKKQEESGKSEDEIQSSVAYISTLLTKVGSFESQLESIGKSINSKTKNFEDLKNSVVKAQTAVKNLTPQYETQLAQIRPRLDGIESELKTIASGIDATLIEKYKNRRKSEPQGKITDIVVPVSAGRCGACFFEMPLSLIHRISKDGYIICEECGKIIHNG